jgi:hypothetical protein
LIDSIRRGGVSLSYPSIPSKSERERSRKYRVLQNRIRVASYKRGRAISSSLPPERAIPSSVNRADNDPGAVFFAPVPEPFKNRRAVFVIVELSKHFPPACLNPASIFCHSVESSIKRNLTFCNYRETSSCISATPSRPTEIHIDIENVRAFAFLFFRSADRVPSQSSFSSKIAHFL